MKWITFNNGATTSPQDQHILTVGETMPGSWHWKVQVFQEIVTGQGAACKRRAKETAIHRYKKILEKLPNFERAGNVTRRKPIYKTKAHEKMVNQDLSERNCDSDSDRYISLLDR